jgi:hypothetical protein
MQKLALMMAVMILGMSPAHGHSTGVSPGSQGVGDQAEMTLPLSTWSGGDGKTLMAKDRISSAATTGSQPVGPGGQSIGRILQQIQLGIESLGRVRSEILRIRQDTAEEIPEGKDNGSSSGEKGRGYRLEGEVTPKAAEALKKGADATRGRGQRKGRLYQRPGARN